MKKTTALVVLLVLSVVLIFSMAAVALAVPGNQNACAHSHGVDHASTTGTEHASENSVLNRCVE